VDIPQQAPARRVTSAERGGADRFGAIVTDMWAHRFALRNLVMKDFRIRYRNMSLGMIWSVLNPLTMLGVLVVIFTYVYPQEGQAYFPVSVLLGLVSYNLLSLCIPAATGAVLENAALVKKTVFPRQLLPISVVLSQTLQILVQLGLVVIFMVLFRVPVTVKFLLAPFIFGVLLLFVIGVGLTCSALSVIFRDVRYIVESYLTILFWLSPVFYPLTIVHQKFPKLVFGVYVLNPLAGCIEALRRVLLYDRYPDGVSFAIAVIVSVSTLVMGFALFSRLQRRFADLV
jgi:ABC-type polysaccharide/polyol phosphate export permease